VIVLDASAAIDLLLDAPPHARSIEHLLATQGPAAAPHLLDVEVAQVLRRFVLAGKLSERLALAALEDLAGLPIARYDHVPLLSAAFGLRQSATVYDAIDLVLAEALGATLVTRDKALASVPGTAAKVKVLA
jgi:predicted nucleic acid-binding protein